MRVLRLLSLLFVLALGGVACADESNTADDADEEVSTDATSDTADTDPTTDDSSEASTTPATDADDGSEARDLSDEELALVDLLMDEMRSDAGELDGAATEEEEVYVRCAAEGIVAELGVERLAELGVSAEAIEAGESTWGDDDFTLEDAGGTLEEARIMADLTYGCGFLDLMSTAFGEMSPDESECLTAAVDSDEFRDAFAQSIFSGDDSTLDELMDQAMGECFTPSDFLPPTTDGSGGLLGEDPDPDDDPEIDGFGDDSPADTAPDTNPTD